MKSTKPTLLFYCQHSLGMGHLVRALTLAAALAEQFKVVLLNGGRFPEPIMLPVGVDIINLPPLGMNRENQLFSQDEHYSLEAAHEIRRRMILNAYATYQPEVILIELFPFGRKKFACELLPLLKTVKRQNRQEVRVFCSLRDIMVNARKDQLRHDNRACWLIERYFDAIMVHSDIRFARLEESFNPTHRLKTAVYYTGFVLPREDNIKSLTRERRVIVSAGGGMVGGPLFRAALDAHRILWEKANLPMTLVAGPFLPEQDWRVLQQATKRFPGLRIHRSVPGMQGLLAKHCCSVSQCGYNTAMDLLKSGVAALVVPFSQGQEDEQGNRARRLAKLGLLRTLDAELLNGERLADEIEVLQQFAPNPVKLDMDGARQTTKLVEQLLASGKSKIYGKQITSTGVANV